VFHANQQIDAACEYTYDATYRLINATGREHIGQSAFNFLPDQGDDRDYPFEGAACSTDLQALQRYTEGYEYDAAGNFLKMFHRAARRNWRREYRYCEPSLLDPANKSNRLSGTALDNHSDVPVERYLYDAHGNITHMPHLPSMEWNYKDQLSATSRQVVKSGGPKTTYYVYDASGRRARKVTDSKCGKRSSERFYIGGFEVFREFSGGEVAMERETLHIMDDTRRIALVETKTIEDGDEIHTPTPKQRYQLANHLGSASVEVDEAGGLITYEEYSPYGNSTYQAGTGASEVSLKRYRYTGKERDEESGFVYYGARYYTPWLGRWTSCDPIGVKDGMNVYSFVHNRPNVEIDPTGRDGEPWWRFTEAGGQYQTGKNDIFQTNPGYDTGFAPLNLVVNLFVTASNVATIPFNAATELASVPDDIARAAGVSDQDIDAMNFALMMTGVGEVAALPEIARGMGAVSEAKTVVTTATEGKDVVTVVNEAMKGASEGKQVVSTVAEEKKIVTATTEAKNAVTTANEAEGIAAAKAEAAPAAATPLAKPAPLPNIKPDVPTQEIVPVDRVARGGKAFAPKVNNAPGAYRGITPKMRREAQRLGETYQGPGKYDVGHRTPLSQTPPPGREFD
jgi:RHS repeat-associated protein